MYNVEFTRKAKRQIKKLDKNLQNKIISSIKRIRIRPFKFVKKLVNLPLCSLRVGDYRIILNINKGKLIILILEVGHRKNIYK